MKFRQVTERIGEDLGPIDWNFDFDGFGRKYNLHPDCVKQATKILRNLKLGDLATTDGGWPRVGFHEVISISMYDGWPFWYPVPSVQTMGVLGTEWHPWYSITEVMKGKQS